MQLRRRIDLWQRGSRRFPKLAAGATIAVVGVGFSAALALASSPPTLSLEKGVAVKNKTENVVANARGLTVYTLSGETLHHLKCTKANTCFSFWFPVKAGSSRTRLAAAHGVKGRVGTLRRNGFRQVTLNRRPLYTFIGDASKKRRSIGEGVVSFGGTWHVVSMGSTSNPTMTGPMTSTTTSMTTTTPYYP